MAQHFRSRTLRARRCPKPAGQNIIDFVERRLGFHPDPQQRLLLTTKSKRVILNCTRQWGKTAVSVAKALHRALTVPGSLIIVASPSLRQSGEWMSRARAMLRSLGIRPRGDGANRISLRLPRGSRIIGLPDAEATIRGFSAPSMVIVDEAARVSDETYYEGLRPMLSTGNGDLWMLSTPRGKRGFFYDTWRKATAQPGPGVVRGNEEEPEWLCVQGTADDCERISSAFLAEQRSVMSNDSFRQEHMCEFLGSGGALFDPDLIAAAMDDDLAPI